MIGARMRCVILHVNEGSHASKHVDCARKTRATRNHVRSQTAVVDGIDQLRRLPMKQLTHVDEAVVCCPVHCIVAFIVAIINDCSGCKQKICQAHVTALDCAQKWSEAKNVSEVNIGAGVQQIERGSNETANGGPVKGRLAVFAALVDGGSSRDQVLHDKRSLRK